jgi:L-rhamnose isomerase/sugar isomerase
VSDRERSGPVEASPELKARFWERSFETSAWGYVATGSRFNVFPSPGAARNVFEKIDDVAEVHRRTGVSPSLALNSVADLAGVDPGDVRAYAEARGVRIGSLTPNLAREQLFRFGSLTNSDPAIRKAAASLIRDALDVAPVIGADAVMVWIPDGTHYPGQADFVRRKHRLTEQLIELGDAAPADVRCLLEYKLFEPAPYHTDIADWGMAASLSRRSGGRWEVLVDLGHHAHGTNVEHLVAILLDEGQLGGLHLNDRKSADDDLTLGSIDPYALFLIFHQLVSFDPERAGTLRCTFDQHHSAKPPLLATVQSIDIAQELYLKALLVDREALSEHQEANRVVEAERTLREPFFRDVRPLLEAWRVERGLPADPVGALLESGLLEDRANERTT